MYHRFDTELWEKRGYASLGLTSQNLRDQEARLEKTMPMVNLSGNTNDNEDTRLEQDIANSAIGDQDEIEEEARGIEALATPNANLGTSNLDLHEAVDSQKTSNSQRFNEHKDEARALPSYVAARSGQRENVTEERASTRLPEYNPLNKPTMVEWGKDGNGAPILIQTSDITEAYNEIISWRKNVFLVPYGKLGRDFIDQLTMHINQWNNKSGKQH